MCSKVDEPAFDPWASFDFVGKDEEGGGGDNEDGEKDVPGRPGAEIISTSVSMAKESDSDSG